MAKQKTGKTRRHKDPIKVTDVLFYIPTYFFYAFFTFICIFPFYYMFINAISANDLSARGLIVFLPQNIHFNNFAEVFRLRGIGQAAMVSVARTVIGTTGAVLCTSFVAYLLTKDMWGRKFWYRFFIVTMYLNVGLVPWFLNMQMLGLTNNFLAYVIGVVNPFNLVLTKTFIDALPASVEESAEIDGAGPLKIFFRLILPLSKPILATTAVFTAVLQWNSFIDNLILMPNAPNLNTLQFVLWELYTRAASVAQILQGGPGGMADPALLMTGTSLRMTISIVVVFPILLVYPFFQRYFVKGIMLGAVKG